MIPFRLTAFFAFLTLLLPAYGQAYTYDRYQNAKPPEPFKIDGSAHLGFRGGIGSSSFTGTDIGNDTESDQYSSGGVFITYWLTHTLAVETELNFTQTRGIQTVYNYISDSSIKGGGYFYYDDISWKLTHLEIPILIRWATSDEAHNPDGSLSAAVFEPYFEFGTAVSFKMAQTCNDDFQTSPPGMVPAVDHLNWGSTSIGLVVGSGANLKVGPGFITMQTRFCAGLVSLGGGADEAQSMAIAFLFGYGWRIR
ncbi:MAG: outer membrane beta-barrel protein [bacterium]